MFTGHEGETFRVRSADDVASHRGGATDAQEVILIEVSTPPVKKERPFSLVFHGSPTPHLQQGTFRFEHDALGTFDLFIVPLGPDDDNRHMRYEAVFN